MWQAGNRSMHDKKEIVNVVFYIIISGCQWWMLPKDFSPYLTLHWFYRRYTIQGIWKKVLSDLVKLCRLRTGRSENPSYSIIDSHSVKQPELVKKAGSSEKKIKKRKRHVVVNTQGNLLHVNVHKANKHNAVGCCNVFQKVLQNIWR